MLQVDENIGGRQDQKNNGLQTKTLAVGLLMVVGCFVVGFFNPTTTATTTMSSNGNFFLSNVQQIHLQKFYLIHSPQSHAP